jgi:type I restriction enzyme M protein
LAWLFFLKAFDEAELRREEEGSFDDRPYQRRLGGKFAWSSWARKTDRPDEMLEFVERKLWMKLTSSDPKVGWATMHSLNDFGEFLPMCETTAAGV